MDLLAEVEVSGTQMLVVGVVVVVLTVGVLDGGHGDGGRSSGDNIYI